MSNETLLLAFIAVLAPILAAMTGLYQAQLSRRNKTAEAMKTQAEADQIAAQVRVLYLENEKHLLERIVRLENEKDGCGARLDALEVERDAHKRQLDAARRIQKELETELAEMRERYEGQIMQLQAENIKLKAQIERLASRVETGELKE